MRSSFTWVGLLLIATGLFQALGGATLTYRRYARRNRRTAARIWWLGFVLEGVFFILLGIAVAQMSALPNRSLFWLALALVWASLAVLVAVLALLGIGGRYLLSVLRRSHTASSQGNQPQR